MGIFSGVGSFIKDALNPNPTKNPLMNPRQDKMMEKYQVPGPINGQHPHELLKAQSADPTIAGESLPQDQRDKLAHILQGMPNYSASMPPARPPMGGQQMPMGGQIGGQMQLPGGSVMPTTGKPIIPFAQQLAQKIMQQRGQQAPQPILPRRPIK